MSEKQHSGSTDAGERAVQWVQHHKTRLTLGVATLFLVGGGAWFARAAQVRREAFSERELSQARLAANSGNLQLAASDLGRIISSFGGTPAGQEAVVILANVHLQQQQPELAVTELRNLLSQGPAAQFRGPASALLGAALEDMGRNDEAADAFEQAAADTPYDLISGQYRLDHGRNAALAGDTTRAAAAYEAIIDADATSPAAAEATFRLAELRKAFPRRDL